MARLSLSDADKQARDWFQETTEALGCTVTVDAMGNQFAVRKGLKDGAPTYAGSHLDTQPSVWPKFPPCVALHITDFSSGRSL